ncbi:MAG: ribosome rescue protein RqcH [Candidatus Bathyarchaeia archaeon]
MPKKEFTSFDIAATITELKKEITDTRVNNIYQLDPKTLTLKLHKPNKPPIRLIMEAGKRLHTTAYTLEPPHNPPAFCMALRKHLRNAWLTQIAQQEFERITTLTFKTHEATLSLILELFGDGNLILTNQQNTILQAQQYKRMKDRNILPNQPYQLPPTTAKNPLKTTCEELTEVLKKAGNAETVKTLARALGIGGTYAEELLLRTNTNKTKPSNQLTEQEITAIFTILQDLLDPIRNGKLEPNIILDKNGNYIDVVPLKLKRYQDCKTKDFDNFNAALDEFYLKTTTVEKVLAETQITELTREQEKLQRVIAEQQRIIAEAEQKAENDTQTGNTIYAHQTELQTLLDIFAEAKNQGKDWNKLIPEIKTHFPNVEAFDPRNLAVNLTLDNRTVSLNLRKSLFENAAEYYERGKKAKQKAAGAKAAFQETQKQLAQTHASIAKAEQEKTTKPQEIIQELTRHRTQPKEWHEKLRSFTSTEGFLVVAGKDAVTNEILIKKHTQPSDIVFHADITGSPFVVIKTESKTPAEPTLQQAAEFAAAHSRAWRENMGTADIYHVKPEQLSKSGPTGEYVPHGAFAVTGKRNWLRSVPLRIAVGAKVEDGELSFVGGPVDVVKASAKAYVVLGPGELSGKALVAQILGALSAKLPKEVSARLGKANADCVREFVPYGKGRVVSSV